MASTSGRRVVVPLTNKSGSGVVAGDVVVVGTANNDAFTTTTSAGFTGTVGIAQETIADNATGKVLLSGYAALINTTASVTRQNFGTTSTTVKKAVDAGSSRTAGTFVQFLTGGTTPDGIVFPADLGSGSGTGTVTTVEEADGSPTDSAVTKIVFPNGSLGIASHVATYTPVAPAFALYKRTSGDYTTTSATFVDIDGTNLALTITTRARRVRLVLTGTWNNSGANNSNFFDFTVDGTREGGTDGIFKQQITAASGRFGICVVWITGSLSAGSHTFKAQWKTNGGTATLRGGGGGSEEVQYMQMTAEELEY